MTGIPKEQKIPTKGDSSRQQSFQQPDPSSIHMQQAQDGQLPPAYAASPSPAPIPLQPQFQQPQFQQPQPAHFQQGQFAQPQQQYFIQLPDGTMQAVPVQPPMLQQPIMMIPAKEQPTIIVNNTPSASASAAAGAGAGGGGSNTDACLAGFCGGCAACLCCSVM